MSRRLGLGICLGVAAFFFADVLLTSRTLLPAGHLEQAEPWKSFAEGDPGRPAQHDLIFQFYPWALEFKRAVSNGEFPLWNPSNFLGTAFFANPQTALLFPLTWLHLLLPLEHSFSWFLLGKLVLALTGMYLWLLQRNVVPMAALAGSLIFSLSMHTVVSLPFPYSSVTVLLPWVMLSAGRLWRKATARSVVELALVMALIVFAGQPQSALASFLLVGLTGLVWAWQTSSGSRLLLLASAFLLAGLLSAVQWLPSMAFVSETMVSEGPRIIRSGFAYAPATLLGFLIPDFFGSMLREDFWGFPGYHDAAFYSSAVALVLAPFGLASQCRRRATRPLLVIAIALPIILGMRPFDWLLDLPGFDLIRRSKLVPLLIFSLAELAALGASVLMAESRRERSKRLVSLAGWCLFWILLGAVGLLWFQPFLDVLDRDGHTALAAAAAATLVAVAAAFIIGLPRRWLGPGLLCLLLLDLGLRSYPLNARGGAHPLYRHNPITRLLEPKGDLSRLRGYAFGNVFPPNSNLAYGFDDIRGYDVMTPQRLLRYMQAIDPELGNVLPRLSRADTESIHTQTRMVEVVKAALAAEGEPLRRYLERDSYPSVAARKVVNARLFLLLQPDFVVAARPISIPGLIEAPPVGRLHIYRNPGAVPARLYTDWKRCSAAEALGCLEKVDPAGTAIIETDLPVSPGNLQTRFGGSEQGRLQVRRIESGRHRKLYQVVAEVPSVLVEFNRYSSGWEARLADGSLLEIFPANYLFRGVFLPAGEHRVEFLYRPRSFRFGLGLSLIGLVTGAFLFLVGKTTGPGLSEGSRQNRVERNLRRQ